MRRFHGRLDKKSLTSQQCYHNIVSVVYSLLMMMFQNVIKDADVQKMLSNTLEEDISKHQEATYEPKMTRAKMKQVLAKEGNVCV